MKRGKLDYKSEIGIFVGYSSTTKGYRVYQPSKQKVIVSRDIKFNEDSAWNWEKTEEDPNQPTPRPILIQEQQRDDDIIDQQEVDIVDDETYDHTPVRGTRSLANIYARCNLVVFEPAGYEEAAKDPKWIEAMKEELRMIQKNQTWILVDKPNHKKPIGVKWVFRTKLNFDGSVNEYKARLVVKGYAQQFGVDFSETFAPVARLDTIRLLLALAAQKCWKVYQLDVKSAFLNGHLEEEIFIE